MIILPLGKYFHKHLPMGVSISQDIFQQKMNDLLQVFEFICAYIDKLFILTTRFWADHVHKLELNIKNQKQLDLNVILKSISLYKTKLNI